MDRITIKNLTFHSLHGFFSEEREKGNEFEVDVSFWLPLERAAENDDLSLSINYSEAASVINNIMHGESVKLIETLVYSIGESLNKTFPLANKIEVVIRKRNPPMSSPCEYSEVRSQWPKS